MSWIKKNKSNVEWLVTLPGDTPFIPLDLIYQFKKKISPKLKIILAKSNDNIHPVMGAWHSSLFESLDKNLEEGIRKIMLWARLHPMDSIDFSLKDFDPFFNINNKEDIITAEEIEKNF